MHKYSVIMHMISRILTPYICENLCKSVSGYSCLLLGPRQTGKTTLVHSLLPSDAWVLDRLLAALGKLEDAAPLFARAPSVLRAGVLLAIPSLVACGLLAGAWRIYGTLGPAFYSLRTTLVAYVLLALLRIPRPENLKE
jgi:hypothetical protein